MVKFVKFIIGSLTIAVSLSGHSSVFAQDTAVEEISDYVLDKLPKQIAAKFPDTLIKDMKTKSDFEAVMELGGFASDNISVSDIDVSSENDDIAAKASLLLSYDQGLGENLNLGVSYKGSQTLYEDFTDFDFRSHIFSAMADYKYQGYKFGVILRNVDSSLADEEFLSLTQISPYVSKFIGPKTFLRAAYGFSDKSFENVESRDATEHQGRIDAYHFLDGTRRYFILGYTLEHSDAEGDPFDFLSHQVKLRYVHKFSLASRNLRFGASYSYERREYENLTPSINQVRADERHRAKVNLTVPFNKNLYSRIEYQYQLNDSNLSVADFDRNIVTTTFGVKF